jgi:DNA polymerase III subunit epsilon
MKLKFEKPIAFFDLETTGTNTITDRIVSISIIKVFPNGEKVQKSAYINPEMTIPEESIAVHGVTNEMVADKPKFKQLAKAIYNFMKDCDLAGYNSNYFDIPLLSEEFARVDILFPLPHAKKIDVCSIFKKKESRTLTAAMMFYCGKDHSGAHNSDADTLATYEIFCKQLEKYEDLTDKDVNFFDDFCNHSGSKTADLSGKIGIDENGDFFYTFGKSKGIKVKDDISFAQWMLDKDFFSRNTKAVLKSIIEQ